jgi:pyrimidine operon attenuation protein/uracil phosphoribosyltransferase
MNQEILFEQGDLARAVVRMAHEVVEQCDHPANVVLVGIRSRGVHLARRMARSIGEIAGIVPPVGVLDITPYRDDRALQRGETPPGAFELAVAVDDKIVVLIDDVIFRGRTIRAALEGITQYGQPKRILVAVLVDRGARELPIRADIVGKNIEAGEGYRVNVMLEELDGIDQITVARWQVRE